MGVWLVKTCGFVYAGVGVHLSYRPKAPHLREFALGDYYTTVNITHYVYISTSTHKSQHNVPIEALKAKENVKKNIKKCALFDIRFSQSTRNNSSHTFWVSYTIFLFLTCKFFTIGHKLYMLDQHSVCNASPYLVKYQHINTISA